MNLRWLQCAERQDSRVATSSSRRCHSTNQQSSRYGPSLLLAQHRDKKDRGKEVRRKEVDGLI